MAIWSFKRRRSSSHLASLGFDLAASIAGATLLGYWVDRYYGVGPWGTVVGAVVGIVGGLLNFVRASRKAIAEMGRADADDESREPGPGDGP